MTAPDWRGPANDRAVHDRTVGMLILAAVVLVALAVLAAVWVAAQVWPVAGVV